MRNRLALGCLATLIACGKTPADHHPQDVPDAGGVLDAGEDASTQDAPPDAPPVDTTAPKFVEQFPAQGASIWLGEPIRFVFDEALEAGAMANLDITATVGGATVATHVALENPTTIAVSIDAAARGTGTLQLKLYGPIADTLGNEAITTLETSFTVQAWHSLPVDRGVAKSSPALAVTDGGTTFAAWLVGTPGNRRVVVSQIYRNEWQALGPELGAADASSVSIALDAAKLPVVAWIENGQAHVARWTSTWTEVASPGAGSYVRLASINGSGSDPIAAVFGASASVQKLTTTGWQPIGATVSINGPIQSEPALAVTTDRIAIGWIDNANMLRVYRSINNGAWTAIAPIDLGDAPAADHLSLAARGSTIAVAWDQWAGSFGILAATAAANATTWTRLGHTLDVDVMGDATAPAIAIDANGAPIVAWVELIETKYRGVVAKWTTSAKWAVVGGATFLIDDTAATPPSIALHAAQAPVIGFASGDAITVRRLNGPKIAPFGIAQRASISGCSFNANNPPQLLSQTGCFTIQTAGRPTPHAGLVPYDLISELWTDGAKKRRWIGLPDGQSMTTSSTGAWAAPNGTVIIKEFDLEITPGNAATRRAIETRFLVKDTNLGWQGFSYKWRVDGTDATLQTDGEERVDWQLAGGVTHTHSYPSRSQCLSCHENSYGPLLGIRPQQLERLFDYNGTLADQLPTLAHIGVGPAVSNPQPFIAPHDPSETAEHRMRGYMAANCAHCHNPQHIAIKDLRYTTPLAQTRLCEVIVPGSPSQSIVYQKVTSRPGMPALGSLYVDPLAQSMLGTWISGMTSCP